MPVWAQILIEVIKAVGLIGAAAATIFLWRYRVQDEKRIEQREEEAKREKRVREMLVILQAEIGINVERLTRQFHPAILDNVRDTMLANLRDDREDKRPDRKDMPTGTAIASNFVFDDLKKDIDFLPADIVEAIVRYYKYDMMLNALIVAFANGLYENLSDQRQIRAVDEFLLLGTEALRSALAARRDIDFFLNRPSDHYQSRRAAGPSETEQQLLAALSDQRNDRTRHD